jgi:dihydropyrimidinase
VELVSTAPAKLFGMYPRKGTIAVGSDADIVIYDPNAKHVLSAATHHMAVDYSCYEGRQVQGIAETVLSRGTVLVRNREWVGPKGHGRFVKRSTADFARRA